jgi:electron transfer flavoprotein alpha subunit
VIERKGQEAGSGDITAARVIVCAGRGIEKQEDLAMVRELADTLGAEIACTRPISEEKHWMTEESCIGLSAKEVKPALYIGVGVSGQIQHVVGIREAGVICAINSDENAPIFEAADYGIIGDLYKVVPALIAALKK